MVAYYLESHAPDKDRKQTLETGDIEKYFKQAGFPLAKRMEQVLPDAKAAGYLDAAGRGRYKLNPVGYNLVVHSLPKVRSGPQPRNRRSPKPTADATQSAQGRDT